MEEMLVKPCVPFSEDVIKLSLMDQQAQRNYGNLLLIFEITQKNKVEDVIRYLKQGLEAALSETPDFASTVIPLPGSKRKELELRLSPDSGVPFRVIKHDASSKTVNGWQSPLANQSYDDLAGGNFAIADIPQEALFVPHPSCEEECPQGLAALLAQINLIDGGLILALSWHHTVSDGLGFNILLKSWARHTKNLFMNGVSDTIEVCGEQTRQRWRLNYGSRNATIDQLPYYIVDSAARSPLSLSSPHLLDRPDPVAITAKFSTWYFSAAALQSLRDVLGETEEAEREGSQFTQSEAVSAIIWKHLSLARLLHESLPEGFSLFSTRINFRARGKPPFHDGFIGNITEPNARVRMPISELCAPSTPKSLATLALAIRTAANALDDEAMRLFIGVVETLPSITDLSWDYDTFPGPDLAVSDTSSMDTLHQDWGGPLGYPLHCRSGSREKGLAYVLPQDRHGGVEIHLQCEGEAVERLRNDSVFTQYAEFQC